MALTDGRVEFDAPPPILNPLPRGNRRAAAIDGKAGFLRQERVAADRRRREWTKRRRAAARRRTHKGRHPARDREVLKRLKTVASETGSDDATAIATKLGECIAGKSQCRLWVCSKCASQRSQEHVEGLLAALDDANHADLAAFTVVLGAFGGESAATSVAAATEARRQIERLRQRTRRSGLDLSYWGQVELAFTDIRDSEDGDHNLATLTDIAPGCVDFDNVVVPHVHGFLRVSGQTTIADARRHLRAVFPNSRQVVVKSLHEDQTKDEGIERWGKYATKSEVKKKRSEPRRWFGDLLSGYQLLYLSLFQKKLKLRNGQFTHKFTFRCVNYSNKNEDESYLIWLISRQSICRDDRLRDSYSTEIDNIHKAMLDSKRLYYTTLSEKYSDDNNEKREGIDNRSRRDRVLDRSVYARSHIAPQITDPTKREFGDPLLSRPRPSCELLVVLRDDEEMGHSLGLVHVHGANRIPDG